jgi:antitoxin VapB
MAVAKVFFSGRSQAVRLPKDFRVNTAEVYITKEAGRIILVPKPKITWKEFFKTEACPDFDLERDTAPPPERDLF